MLIEILVFQCVLIYYPLVQIYEMRKIFCTPYVIASLSYKCDRL